MNELVHLLASRGEITLTGQIARIATCQYTQFAHCDVFGKQVNRTIGVANMGTAGMLGTEARVIVAIARRRFGRNLAKSFFHGIANALGGVDPTTTRGTYDPSAGRTQYCSARNALRGGYGSLRGMQRPLWGSGGGESCTE